MLECVQKCIHTITTYVTLEAAFSATEVVVATLSLQTVQGQCISMAVQNYRDRGGSR